MPYPVSPFSDAFNIIEFLLESEDDSNYLEIYFQDVLKWLCSAPKVTSYRVNTLKFDVDSIYELIQEEVVQFAKKRLCEVPLVVKFKQCPDAILIHNVSDKHIDLYKNAKEVIVDVQCAAAVLRGAHIYAPGVMGMMSGTHVDDKVSIYADVSGKCKKGFQREYLCAERIFIGNGLAKMRRHELFGDNLTSRGIAVEVTDTISGCPNINKELLPKGAAVLQNIPSIVCVCVLDPQEGETVLDMCAAPGNKTTHIAALMKNKGMLVAIDKTPNKVKQLEDTCNEFNAKVHIMQADSTKLLSEKIFSEDTFDRILLDAPCSALGQRPQLLNKTSKKVLSSYAPLQKKLFSNAVHLLKVNGRLVYSTCTITLTENERIVAWALKTFPYMELIKVEPFVGGVGLSCHSLTEQQRYCLQRFGPEQDSIGFFIAVFVKKKKQE